MTFFPSQHLLLLSWERAGERAKRQLRTPGTGTQLFITESFHRDKAQTEAHDKFREAYWKNVHGIILEVVKKTHIERTNHERIIKHRKKFKHLISSVI